MYEHLEQPYAERETLFSLNANPSDTLGVLSSTRPAVLQARSVTIATDLVPHVARQLLAAHYPHLSESQGDTLFVPPAWPAEAHFFDGTWRTVNWLLLLDALNFCFWGEKGQSRWQIDYQGQRYNGYWAETAALRRAVDEGIPLWDAEYLRDISRQQLATLLRGPTADDTAIPLFEQRLEITREVGKVLLERFDGRFSHAVEQCQRSGVQLVHALASNFSSFNDRAVYRGQEIAFFKRAQICVSDLYSAFGNQSWGSFSDIDQLTIFADYKLPQVLRHSGMLIYSPHLAEKVDHQELLVPGGEEEIEIRAATIWSCELLRRAMTRIAGQPITAADVDQILWHLGQDATNMQPYHRVRTIYY